MTKKANKLFPFLMALLAVMMAAFAGPASAATKHFERVLNMTDMQRMLTQKISKETMLIALGVEAERNVRNLQKTRDLFDRTLKGLREGDVELGLPPITNSKILKGLDEVEELWRLFDDALKDGIAKGKISRDQVGAIADLNLPLLQAVTVTVNALAKEAEGSNIFTMLGIAIDLSGRQRMLSQKMSKEFLLIAYGHEVEKNRQNLAQTMSLFDHTLDGLINGDIELQLIPAPTPEIKLQLRKVQRIWEEFQPHLKSAAEGDKPNSKAVSQVARMNLPLLKAMNTAVFMFESL